MAPRRQKKNVQDIVAPVKHSGLKTVKKSKKSVKPKALAKSKSSKATDIKPSIYRRGMRSTTLEEDDLIVKYFKKNSNWATPKDFVFMLRGKTGNYYVTKETIKRRLKEKNLKLNKHGNSKYCCSYMKKNKIRDPPRHWCNGK